MLWGYGARNCWCFKEWMEIDFSLNENVPKDVSMGLPVSTALCLKGANASGKTSALKVLSFIVFFATRSFSLRPEDGIPFESFFHNTETSEFYISFSHEDTLYRWEFEVLRNKILSEKLFAKQTGADEKEKAVFERKEDEVVRNSLFANHESIKYRKNVSFISMLHQFEVEEIAGIYSFFDGFISNVSFYGYDDESFRNVNIISYIYKKNPGYLKFARDVIKIFDVGVENIEIKIKSDEEKEVYYPVFYHKADDALRPLLIHNESSGTRALFFYLGRYYEALTSGGVILLDEFDVFLHPELLQYLLRFFINSDFNKKGAQAIFSTQNIDIMDRLLKYRLYIFQKEAGRSFCYRLDELPSSLIRNDRPVSSLYRKNVLGGVPEIGQYKGE